MHFDYSPATDTHTVAMVTAYLLQFEDVFVEVLLQLLVGIVDTELFK